MLDVNVDLYPVKTGEKVALCLAPSLNLDGSDMPTGDPGQQIYDTVWIVLKRMIYLHSNKHVEIGSLNLVVSSILQNTKARLLILLVLLQSIGKRPSLADKYDYVMFGKVFKYKDAADSGQVKADVRLFLQMRFLGSCFKRQFDVFDLACNGIFLCL